MESNPNMSPNTKTENKKNLTYTINRNRGT
jgi:hypothetical protein